MRKAKPRPIPRVIREQIEAMSRERMEAVSEAARAMDEATHWKKAHEALTVAAAELRKLLEDMRRQRDIAVDAHERAEQRYEAMEIDLARCMGWIDAKQDKPPYIGGPIKEMPF